MDKPLFIPLQTPYYLAFQNGDKTEELRRYGPGWNENTCYPGRAVTLSKGYGKQQRMAGIITSFRTCHATELPTKAQADVLVVYGSLDLVIACIGIKVTKPHG